MIYSEEQKRISHVCGRICFILGQGPNAIAPEKYRSWAKEYLKDGEPVRAWMLWLPTVLLNEDRKNRPNKEELDAAKCREYIARMIAETDPESKKHDYHTSNK